MPISKVSASTEWNLQVNNANTTINYSYDQLLAMPVTTVNANLACYGSPIANGDWSGVSLSYLLEQSGLDQTIVSVNFVASDGYKVSLSLEEAMQSDVIIAYQLNGVPLGETLRLVMPEYNGNSWISRITSITTSASTAQSSSSGNVVKVPNISVWQSRIPPSAPAQNTSLKNEAVTAPTAPSTIPLTVPSTLPSTNVTQPTQSTSVQQESNSKGLGFPVEVVYGIALGVTIALVVVIQFSLKGATSENFHPLLGPFHKSAQFIFFGFLKKRTSVQTKKRVSARIFRNILQNAFYPSGIEGKHS